MSTVRQNLVDLSDFAGRRLLTRVAGLTDDEYYWEPVPDVWTVHAGPDGTFRVDTSRVQPEPPPFTTLAWRITHLIDVLLAPRTATWFGLEPLPDDGTPGVPGTAADAVRDLERAFAVWQRRLGSVPEEVLPEPLGEIAGVYASQDGTAFALHILDELIHHGAEVGVVRDLYRQQQPQDPFVAACLTGDLAAVDAAGPEAVAQARAERPGLLAAAAGLQHWEVVRRLAGLGFDVDGRGPGGLTAAHLAARADDVAALRVLVEHGADLSVTDPTYLATPLGWAEYFGQPDAAAYLRELDSAGGG
jgi:Ankyrin repeats (3 copies)/DinB superfamily